MTAQTPLVGALRGDAGAPSRDRPVNARAVACPVCKSPVGYPCVSSTGGTAHHGPRRRMALRAESASYDVADVTFARRTPTYTRRALRDQSGLDREAVAEVCGTTAGRIGTWERGGIPGGPEGATYGRWLRAQLDDQQP